MISILIPTKRGDELPKCLESIKKHTQGEYEIILLDYEGGFNQKLNDGFKRSVGEYIIILHDDNEVLEGWADQLEDVGAFHCGELKDTNQIHGATFSGQYVFNAAPDYSAFIQMSRKVAKKVFPLDENYHSPWCADADMGRKIKKLGLKIKPLKGKIIHWHSYGAGVSHAENERYYHGKWD